MLTLTKSRKLREWTKKTELRQIAVTVLAKSTHLRERNDGEIGGGDGAEEVRDFHWENEQDRLLIHVSQSTASG